MLNHAPYNLTNTIIATRHPIDKSVWMNLERAIKVAEKKPMDPDFVDTIARKPAEETYCPDEYSSSSEEGSASYVEKTASRKSDFDVDTAMEEAMQSTSDEEEREFYSALTNPSSAVKRPAPPLFDCCDWLSSKIREAYEDEQGRQRALVQ